MADAPRLNGFDIPQALLALMMRPDWEGQRRGEAWVSRFSNPRPGFVDFCSLDYLEFENADVRNPDLAVLNGKPDLSNPPGDFDPEQGFVIGFVDYAEATICVDFRPGGAPRIIFYNCHTDCFTIAFDTLDAFCAFYKEQHGEG